MLLSCCLCTLVHTSYLYFALCVVANGFAVLSKCSSKPAAVFLHKPNALHKTHIHMVHTDTDTHIACARALRLYSTHMRSRVRARSRVQLQTLWRRFSIISGRIQVLSM